MGMVALRIPDKMRKEMDRIKINWSDYIRRSINEILESEKKRVLIQKLHAITKNQKPVKSGTAAMLIRHIRDNA